MPAGVSRDTRATLRYFASNPPPEVLEDGVHTLGDAGKSREDFKRLRQLVTEPREVNVMDATQAPGGLGTWTLEKHGFTVIPAFPPAADWRNRDQVYAEYIPPYVELAKKMTGGKDHVVLKGGNGYFYRNEEPRTATEAYSRFTHTDAGPDVIQTFRNLLVKRGVPEEEARTCDICIFNVWHPVDRPAFQNPLCLLDATSVDLSRDVVKYKYRTNDTVNNQDRRAPPTAEQLQKQREAENAELAVGVIHSPAHRWVFIPDMSPDQAYLFKQYDTRGGKDGLATCTFHDSFHDPTHEDKPKDTHGRRSCEFRFFLTYPKPSGADSSVGSNTGPLFLGSSRL